MTAATSQYISSWLLLGFAFFLLLAVLVLLHMQTKERQLRQRNEILQKREAQLAEAQEVAHVGSWEWDIVNGTLTWSDELYRIYGLKPQQFNPTYEVFLSYVHAEDRERVDSIVQKAFSDHQPFDFYHRTVEERTLNGRGQVIVDDSGNPIRMLGTSQDVTEHKKVEQARKASEEYLQLIVTKASDAFVAIDADGLITAWNPAAETTFGWLADEVLGKSLKDTIVPPSYREAHEKGLQYFLATGEGPVLGKRMELPALCKNGTEILVELAISAIEQDGKYLFNAFLHQITERKRTE